MNTDFLYQLFLNSTGISTDTRKITPGSLFFALRGPNFNANTFALEALQKGAAYAIIDDETYAHDSRCICVDNTLESLQQLARHHRRQLNIPVIAIVGSNGKTTTKELITSCLSTTFNVWATPGNLNNHIGLPLTLLQLTPEHEVAVIEMGANHIGENEVLCNIAEPTLGIVTNNGMDHLEGFGDIEGVAKSNSELYYFLLKNNGLAFVNAHDEWLVRMSARLNTRITYAANTVSREIQANIIGVASQLQPNIQFSFQEVIGHSVLSGDYNFDNIMAAIAISTHLGVSAINAVKGISDYTPKNNRSQWIQKTSSQIFMDAYNANPSSMEAALRNFAAIEGPLPKMVIMGDMFEMGQYAASEHQRMVDLCKSLNFETIVIIGEHFMQTNHEGIHAFSTTKETATWIEQLPVKNRLIFLKGSRGMKLETLEPLFS